MNTTDLYDVIIKIAGEDGLKRLITEATDVQAALGKVTEAADVVQKKTFSMGSAAAAGKGLFAAFQGGEIGGIVRGVGELVDVIPGLSTFSGAIKKIGDVAEVGWPMLKDLFGMLTSEPEKIAEGAKAIADYGERINDLGETVKNLTDRQAGLNAEMERGKKAVEEQAASVERLRKLQQDNEPEKEAAKERGENLTSVFRGQQEDIVEALAIAQAKREAPILQKTMDDLLAGTSFQELMLNEPEKYDKAMHAKKRLRQLRPEDGEVLPKDVQDKAWQTAASAIDQGDANAIRDVVGLLPETGRGSQFRRGFQHELPENKAAEAAAEQAEDDANARYSENAKKHRAFIKEGQVLQRQGEAIQEQGEREQEREKHADEAAAAQRAKQFATEAQQAAHDRPQMEAEMRVRQAAVFHGVSLTPAQVTGAAHEALSAVEQGINTNLAILGAIRSVAQRSADLRSRLQAQEANARQLQGELGGLFMGSDKSGQFSLAPVIPLGP